jgi:uncharacterized membrane protein YgdD (TMEM256/DUF423 family)
MYKRALINGAFLLGLAVIFGAFGAHALKDRLDELHFHAFETGVSYQFYHGLALLAAGIIYSAFPNNRIKWAATCFLTGVILFSGSLYTLALCSIKNIDLGAFGILTPIGGLFFIIGWIIFLSGLLKESNTQS